MKLASYVGTRDSIMGLGNRFIRLRLSGILEALKTDKSPDQSILRASHSELVFEPGDGVDHLMPDGTCEPNADGELWCVSSTGLERINSTSPRRPNKIGGVRFKRINVNNKKWELDIPDADPLRAAQWAVNNQGRLYDWQLIFGFIIWLIPRKKSRVMCSTSVATMLGLPDPHRFDPCQLQAVIKWK
jgi:hypothetical protein